MAVHWQINFRGLRTNTLYTINIYDESYTGNPVQLKGAPQPIVVDEDDNDDFYASVRTQSGYIRIIDDGTFNWRDLIPTTDVDRPVTLTHVTNGTTITDWQGFIQSQNFGGKLYERPQERDLPIHCALSVLSRLDVSQSEYEGTQNFAQLLYYIINLAPSLTFSDYVIQGGADARTWLLKKFDWSLFGELGDDGEIVSSFDALTVLGNLCRYWGWTIRTKGQTVYLVAPDDATCINKLKLTSAQLALIAAGTSAGVVTTGFFSTQLITNQFASAENKDFQKKGYNKAVITAKTGEIDENIIKCYPDSVMKTMYDMGFVDAPGYYTYTSNLYTFYTDILDGYTGDNGSFNIMKLTNALTTDVEYMPVIHITGAYNGIQKNTFRTVQKHCYSDGEFQIDGTIYRNGSKFTDHDDSGVGNKHMIMSLGIGETEQTAIWWDGYTWSDTKCTFYVKIGGNTFYTVRTKNAGDRRSSVISTSGLSTVPYGKLFVQFFGSDDISDNPSGRNFDMADFTLKFTRPKLITHYMDPERRDENKYSAKNNSVTKQEWTDELIFATENYSRFGAGIVLNQDNSNFSGWDYSHHQSGNEQPEQHMVDRVVSFWSQSRRYIECEIRADLLTPADPTYKITLDGSTLYPISISYDWYNDIVNYQLIQI